MPTAKTCRDCRAQGLPLTRLAPYPGPRCKTHDGIVQRERRLARKDRHVETTYTLTAAQYEKLYKSQGGRCAGCRRATGAVKRLAVDHDHACCPGPKSCGRCVRGLLCSTCNDVLAHLRDDPATFERMAEYLRVWPSQRAGLTRGASNARRLVVPL
jgi:hypothetical protein